MSRHRNREYENLDEVIEALEEGENSNQIYVAKNYTKADLIRDLKDVLVNSRRNQEGGSEIPPCQNNGCPSYYTLEGLKYNCARRCDWDGEHCDEYIGG